MTSQADDAALSDEPPMHHIISGDEEIARLACRFEEQQNQIVCENEVNTKPILAENEQLKEENAALNSSGQETVYNEFTRVENELELVKNELIQKEGSKIQRIPELEEENENFIKYLEKVKQMYEEQNNHLTEIQEEKSKLDDHITTQKERILVLEEEREAFHSQVEQLQTKTAKQDERLKSLMNDNYTLEANMSAQLMQIQSSDEEIQNLRTELVSVHTTIQIQADEIFQLNKDNSLLVEKSLNQELKLEEMIELEEERKTLLTNLEDLRIKYEEQSEKMSIFRKKSITLDELVATQRQELNSSEKEKEALSKELEKIETTNKKLNDSLRELTKDKEETERIVSIETSVDQQIHMIEEEKQKLHSEQDMTQEKNVELNNEIKGIKQEKDALEKRVFNQRQQLDSFEKERKQMRAQLQTIESTSEEQRNQLQELMKEKHNQHESFETKEQQMKEKDLHYTETYAHENEQLRNELSSVLKDEARLSTYLDPRAIAELYKNLYINVWSRTFETAKNLTFAGNVKNAVIKIIECVEMVNTFCKTECGEIKRHFKEMLEGETADLKADVFDEARIIQMITSGTSELALGLLVQVFMKTLNPGFQLQKLAYASPVFVRECIRIFWLLNVQWPQIETRTIKGGDFNRNVYETFTEEGDKVEYVVWPALIYDETVLAKGVAKCYQSAILTQATSLPPIDVYQETSDKEEGCSSDEDGLEGNMPRYEVLNAALAGLSFTSGVQYNVYTEAEPNDTNGGAKRL
ncbi:uncharacterized protein LOC127878013 isoform X4 [Dreissena polymorpha]|uniref:uncharacterized protein LOC127878013 isoform X4 n=1 Tax=Dreissena polymorpha TaxID=45954 RepID=UPI0022650099|nr:uncharacterized protein LOC127878013 isoform X4 [Dreissena polymorpha]